MGYMANQMNQLLEASEHQHDEACKSLEEEIQKHIKQYGYTWSVYEIFEEYRKMIKGVYVSYSAKCIIIQFKDSLDELIK